MVESRHGARVTAGDDTDESLCARLRDLALVDLDALVAGLDAARGQELAAAYADDCADALRETRARLAVLRKDLVGADPLNILDVSARQRASDAGHSGAVRVHDRVLAQAEAARSFARLAELSAAVVGRLFAADRRR